MTWDGEPWGNSPDEYRDPSDYGSIDGRVIKETQRAYLVMRSDMTEFWVPKSVAQEDGSDGLVVQNWFIEKEGLD